jgi:hypothetical protein
LKRANALKGIRDDEGSEVREKMREGFDELEMLLPKVAFQRVEPIIIIVDCFPIKEN